jgi:hypothetical protein
MTHDTQATLAYLLLLAGALARALCRMRQN